MTREKMKRRLLRTSPCILITTWRGFWREPRDPPALFLSEGQPGARTFVETKRLLFFADGLTGGLRHWRFEEAGGNGVVSAGRSKRVQRRVPLEVSEVVGPPSEEMNCCCAMKLQRWRILLERPPLGESGFGFIVFKRLRLVHCPRQRFKPRSLYREHGGMADEPNHSCPMRRSTTRW
jgi:hypothetical protein